MIKYVLFDLDGTLLSTLDTIRYHLNRSLVKNGLEEITVDDTRRFIGNGARKLVERAAAKSGVDSEEVISEVLTDYNRAYDADPLPCTYPYDGIADLVDALCNEGIKLGVVTNKPHHTAEKLIEHFFPGKFVIVSGGREGIALKPDPEESLKIIALMGGAADECAFVGDTSVDIYTGRNMKAKVSVGVSWGFRTREELFEAGADYIADNADMLLSALKEKK